MLYVIGRSDRLGMPCASRECVEKTIRLREGIYSLTYKQTDRILRGASKRTALMSMRAMWITGCSSTVESDFMMRTGEAKFRGYDISVRRKPRMYNNLPPAKAKICNDLVYTGIRSSVTN